MPDLADCLMDTQPAPSATPLVVSAPSDPIAGLRAAYRLQRKTLQLNNDTPYPLPSEPVTLPRDLLGQVCDDARGFYERGWLMGTSGNLSVREDRITAAKGLYYWLTASGLDKGTLRPYHFTLMKENGKRVTDLAVEPAEVQTRRPSAEALVHNAIYRAIPRVGAVYHVHSPAITWVSQTVASPYQTAWLPLPAVEMLKGLGMDSHETPAHLPVLPNSQDMTLIAKQVTGLLTTTANPVPVLVLRGHGAYGWGRTMADAKRHIEVLDFLCQLMVWDCLAGNPPVG
jgi:methylthioribulose-1-phosphate dehydratase